MEQAIRKLVPEMLESGNLDFLTEKGVRAALEKALGESVGDHKGLISDLIDEFLDSKVDDVKAEPEPPAAGAKRKAKEPAATKPAKAVKNEGAGGNFVKELSGNKTVTVSTFKGKVQVDLREFYEDKADGEMKPGRKGLSLTYDQWLQLKAQLPALLEAVVEGRETAAEPIQLSANRRAYAQKFKSKNLVHVREMYEKDGNMLPGLKGVTLDKSGVEQLLAQADAVTAAAQRLGAKPASAAAPLPAAAPAKPEAKRPAMQENVRPEASGSGSEAFVDLGAERRATVTEFKGKTSVDLREYYEKDGQKLPGKRGIMLNPAVFKRIQQNAAAISDAAASASSGYELDLGYKIRVTISDFKGKTYVGVREFYEKDGAWAPGGKGLNMTPEQWSKLVAGMPQIEAQLAKLIA